MALNLDIVGYDAGRFGWPLHGLRVSEPTSSMTALTFSGRLPHGGTEGKASLGCPPEFLDASPFENEIVRIGIIPFTSNAIANRLAWSSVSAPTGFGLPFPAHALGSFTSMSSPTALAVFGTRHNQQNWLMKEMVYQMHNQSQYNSSGILDLEALVNAMSWVDEEGTIHKHDPLLWHPVNDAEEIKHYRGLCAYQLGLLSTFSIDVTRSDFRRAGNFQVAGLPEDPIHKDSIADIAFPPLLRPPMIVPLPLSASVAVSSSEDSLDHNTHLLGSGENCIPVKQTCPPLRIGSRKRKNTSDVSHLPTAKRPTRSSDIQPTTEHSPESLIGTIQSSVSTPVPEGPSIAVQINNQDCDQDQDEEVQDEDQHDEESYDVGHIVSHEVQVETDTVQLFYLFTCFPTSPHSCHMM